MSACVVLAGGGCSFGANNDGFIHKAASPVDLVVCGLQATSAIPSIPASMFQADCIE